MTIDKQALREAAERATKGPWKVFSDIDTKTFAIHTPRDKRCENVIKWGGFDCQPNAESNAEFIAAFNPKVALALLDENIQLQREKDAIEAVALALRDDMRQAREQLEAAERSIAELERSETQLINERDAAESALADMYQAATGERPEWSNMFGFADAVDVVVDRIADLEAKQPSPVVLEGLVKAVRFYEQVKRENPPVETGAWKDAVDWVLKEACRAALLQDNQRDLSQPVDPQVAKYEQIMLKAGWVMVPVEPTEEMIAAAMECDDVLFNSDGSFCVQFREIYCAMVDAALALNKGEY
ncbi:TPA: ead/Ea22-like family protein [Salmonella enterica]|nr:ead/Ea22-like family protein [Salmonella enterica]